MTNGAANGSRVYVDGRVCDNYNVSSDHARVLIGVSESGTNYPPSARSPVYTLTHALGSHPVCRGRHVHLGSHTHTAAIRAPAHRHPHRYAHTHTGARYENGRVDGAGTTAGRAHGHRSRMSAPSVASWRAARALDLLLPPPPSAATTTTTTTTSSRAPEHASYPLCTAIIGISYGPRNDYLVALLFAPFVRPVRAPHVRFQRLARRVARACSRCRIRESRVCHSLALRASPSRTTPCRLFL